MKRLLEKIRKFGLYFKKSNSSYVAYRGNDRSSWLETKYIGYFPLDYQSTLSGSLFEHFDDQGLPMKYMNGKYIYFHTKVFTYGLAHWNKYLDTGEEKSKEIVLQVKDYILSSVKSEGESLVFREYDESGDFNGSYSGAMEQGLASFLLSAAYTISLDVELLSSIREVINPLIVDHNRGIVLQWNNRIWFEEFPKTGKHVLNGCFDAFIGLWAASQVLSDSAVVHYMDNALFELEEQAKKFDRGWWSSYWVSDDSFNYIASMKYHTIHIYQLRFLTSVSSRKELQKISERFERYANSTVLRLLALFAIAAYKVRMKIDNIR